MNATHLKLLAAVTIATLSSAACSGGSSTLVAPVTPLAAKATPPALGSGSSPTSSTTVAYGQDLMQGATFVKRAAVDGVGVDVLVNMHGVPALLQYAKDANDPTNPLFRHWLTASELGDRFGASESDYTEAAKTFAANGVFAKMYPQRQILRVLGPQANVERALGLQFGVYRKSGVTFIAPMAQPHPLSALHVAALGNVVKLNLKRRRSLPLRLSSAFLNGYSPQQIQNVFDYTGAYTAGYKGDGITIGIIGTGPIADDDPRIDGGHGGDVADYKTLFGEGGTGEVLQDVDTMNVSSGNTDGPDGDQYSSGLATPPPVTSPAAAGCTTQGYSAATGVPESGWDYTTCNPEDGEAQLDTEQASGMAPDSTVEFYIAYNPNECYGTCTSGNTRNQELGIYETDDETQQAIADMKSDVVSMSFGEAEYGSTDAFSPGYFGTGTNDFGPMEYASLLAEGTAIFASSGDYGAEACSGDGMTGSGPNGEDAPCVNYPATDPSVISVGGVNAPLSNSGTLTGPITGWGMATNFDENLPAGSTGGCSEYFPAPSYFSGVTLANGTTPCGGMRAQPDVALDADVNTGVAVVMNAAPGLGGRMIYPYGGTSVSSPEMAAMWALVLQACKQSTSCTSAGSGTFPYRLGNPGNYLYPIYKNAAEYSTTFYDVLFGDNANPSSSGTGLDPGYAAGQGYDLITGIGVPYGANLIKNVLSQR